MIVVVCFTKGGKVKCSQEVEPLAATEVILQSPYTLEIPHEIAQSMGLRPGMRVYLYQLEQTLSIRLQPSKLLDACEQFERIMQEEGVTLDDLLEPLEDEEEVTEK